MSRPLRSGLRVREPLATALDGAELKKRQTGVLSRGGFTLIELVIVVLIIGLASAVILPRLPNLGYYEQSKALPVLANNSQVLYEQAALKKKVLR